MMRYVLQSGVAALALASSTIAATQTMMSATILSNTPGQSSGPHFAPWGELPPETPPPPAPAPAPIQGHIPTDPGYPTAPPARPAAQTSDSRGYNEVLDATAAAMRTGPIPTNPATVQGLATYYLAMANDAVANSMRHPQDQAMSRSAAAYVRAYYDWMTRATGSPYGANPAQVEAQRREAARIHDEQARLSAAAWSRYDQDIAWNRMVVDRFSNSAFDAFDDNGGQLTTLQLEEIYAHYDPNGTMPPASSLSALGGSLSSVGNSLSSAGNSLSAAGWSLSAAGLPFMSGTDDYNDPAVQSLYAALYGLTSRRNPLGSRDGDNAQLADAAYRIGNFDLQTDPTGRLGQESGGYLAANLFDLEDKYLRELTANGLTGLDALLAQPFNVILTWGAGAYDLDLHMTGPLGDNSNNRFHIYYSAPGDLQNQPFAQLIKDCICNSGSEVILTSALNRGGVYRVSAFNYGDQSAGSTNLSNQSQAQIQIVRGGTTQSVGNGTTITGGHTILTTSVPNGGQGNTWVAVELDPKNGRITVPARIQQSAGSSSVQ